MNIFIAQINPVVGDLEYNFDKIVAAAERAKEEGADIVVFPELALAGYPPLDLLKRRDFLEECDIRVHKLKRALPKECMSIVGGPFRQMIDDQERLFSGAYVFFEGEVKDVIKKTLLPTYDVFDETRYFTPNNEPARVIEYKGERIGIAICEDLWNDEKLNRTRRYETDPLMHLMEKHATLIITLSASPWETNKPFHRQHIVTHASRRWNVPIVYANQVGGNDTLIFDGRSFIVREGKVVFNAKAYEEDLSHYDFSSHIEVSKEKMDKTNDLYHALTLGVKDYFHKLGFSKAVIGLSGGIDSSLIAVLAAHALGSENVLGVLMPSGFSSEHSVTDAEALARNLGIKHMTIPIEEPFSGMKTLLRAGVAKSTLTSDEKEKMLVDDLTEENLQARIRGVLLMALSNKYGYLVLATGNKSEMSMGYSTLYGDMCGALAPLGDVFKTEVFALSRFINKTFGEVIPENVLTKPPSAELRPDQKDEDTLPPYKVLDGILRGYIENKLSVDELADEYGGDTVLWVVRMLHRNEYKRQQAPPILKVGKKALRPGRFFPIVQRFGR